MKRELSRIIAPPVPQATHDYAVQFGQQKRDQPLKAYPFFYNFIRYPYQIGTPDDSFGANQVTGIYRVSAADAEGPDGLTIAAGGILDIPIVMDNDSNFHLLYTKFGAFYPRGGQATIEEGVVYPVAGGSIPANGAIIYFLAGLTTGLIAMQPYYVVLADQYGFQISLTSGGVALSPSGTDTGTTITYSIVDGTFGSREYLMNYGITPPYELVPFDVTRTARIPYWTDLDVSMYMTSSASRDLYGGFQREPIGGATLECPIPMIDLQGAQDGIGMLKTPFQLTKSATIMIRIKSRSQYPLRVYGHCFGYKITV